MNFQKLAQMHKVTHAKYLYEFQKVKSILDEETRLRRDLETLRSQAEKGRLDIQNDISLQSVGADILWQGWVVRTRQQLNTELSQVLARKLNALDKVRKAFGRQHAVEIMSEKAESEEMRRNRKKMYDALS